VEIRIGIQNAPREVVLESALSLADVNNAISEALANSSPLTLTDDKGRTIVVPGDRIAFVEIGAQAAPKVGFAN
jgi:hypothetical protein